MESLSIELSYNSMKSYFVYILTNYTNTTFYIGASGNIEGRIFEHKAGKGSVFTSKYNLVKY